MENLMKAERMKLQYPVIFILFLLGALGTVMLGMNSLNSENFVGFFERGWKTFYLHMASFHGLFFYPLYAGVLASFICRYEHTNGGWKQLFCLPIPRYRVYYAKLGTLMLLMGLIQLLFAGSYLLAGVLLQLGDDLDFTELIIGTVGGWLAILPFAALQLWVSMRLKSFVSSLILSASIVIANIVLTGLHASIGLIVSFYNGLLRDVSKGDGFVAPAGCDPLHSRCGCNLCCLHLGGTPFAYAQGLAF